MRLEIEPILGIHPLAEEAQGSEAVDSAEAKSALNLGIKAAQAGNRTSARTSLLRATELDPRSENAWLWLASISEYPEELLGFLNHVLEINPENQRAVEWKTATHALLAKTFVQRGIDATQESRNDFAAECFQTALEYDERNAAAWIWMASLSDSSSGKVTLLENALAVEPDNECAAAALSTAKRSILNENLASAKRAAVSGNNVEAIKILDSLLAVNPDSVEAWTMRSHLSDVFDEKIRCFENILAIEPANVAAKAGRDSLLSIFGTAYAAVEVESATETEDPAAVVGSVDEMDSGATAYQPEPSIDRCPTQDLELPVDFAYQPAEPATGASQEYTEEENENEALEFVAEPFGSFAEETAEPVETTFEPAELNGNGARPEVHFEVPVEQPVLSEADYGFETVAFSYEPESTEFVSDDDGVVESVGPVSDPAIPVPDDVLSATAVAGEDSRPDVYNEAVVLAALEGADCPFCHHPNDPQTICCHACSAVLTLSDLELLLANQNADKFILRQAVEGMERERMGHENTADELVILGLGHLNLRNMQLGYSCLAEASKLDPNNVVLGGQVNALLIRLDEIRRQEEAHLKMPKGKSILVVDDSATVRKLIAGKLEKCGHDVICANDGVEAMERLEHFIPDLILLDITMPRMDGYQVCKTIRSNNPTKDVPVVMISGKDGFFDKVRGRMAGTTGYITKPFGPETLMKAVEVYLSGEVPGSDEA